jgi:hypothetical protein
VEKIAGILTSWAQKQKRVPHLSRLLRKVGTTNACSVAVDLDLAFARVERTLLSVAFDLDFDFEILILPLTSHRSTNAAVESTAGKGTTSVVP